MDAFFGNDRARSLDSPLRGLKCHPGHDDVEIVGRLWDLAKAYRQLARHPAHDSLAIIACLNPATGQPELFRQPSLAFGASASVLAFNWVAFALCVVLNLVFKVGGTNFYDDFTVLEATSLAEDTASVVTSFFTLLGWQMKELADFSAAPEPLGAVLHLDRCREGVATVANRPTRTAEIVECIEAMVSKGCVDAELFGDFAVVFSMRGPSVLDALGAQPWQLWV